MSVQKTIAPEGIVKRSCSWLQAVTSRPMSASQLCVSAANRQPCLFLQSCIVSVVNYIVSPLRFYHHWFHSHLGFSVQCHVQANLREAAWVVATVGLIPADVPADLVKVEIDILCVMRIGQKVPLFIAPKANRTWQEKSSDNLSGNSFAQTPRILDLRCFWRVVAFLTLSHIVWAKWAHEENQNVTTSN